MRVGDVPLRAVLCTVATMGCQTSNSSQTARSPESHEVGAGPRAVAAADLNADGHLDVVVANSGDGTATILLGSETGRLQTKPPAIPCGNGPSDIDAIDLDRDGDLDLVIANHDTPGISVLLNDGRANFTAHPRSPFDLGARPHVHGLATGDFDGDGWIEVAVESADTREVRILQGGATGPTEVVGVSIGTMPYYRLGTGEVTGDGVLDVLVPGHGDSTVRIIHGVDGRLTMASQKLDLAGQPWMVVGDDVSGDGRDDIIAVQTDAVSVWIATVQGFSAAAGSPFEVPRATEATTGDLDGDGVSDIAIGPWDGDEITVIEGRSMSVRKLRACTRPVGLAIGDLDGDGRGELLAGCSTENRLVVLRSPKSNPQSR